MLVAAKTHYFGVGGGALPFKEHVQRSGRWAAERVQLFDDARSNHREIFSLRPVP